jgi:hypothetical protein
MLSPDGKALLWAPPQALDSFQVIYDGDYGGHRADTLALDLISAALKPDSFAHTPLDFNSAQIRTWDVFLAPLPTRLAGAAGGSDCGASPPLYGRHGLALAAETL